MTVETLTRTNTKTKTIKIHDIFLNSDFGCKASWIEIRKEKLGLQIKSYVTFIQQYCQGKFENTFLQTNILEFLLTILL